MRKLSWLFVVLLITACGGSSDEQAEESTQAETNVATEQVVEAVAVEVATRDVACGCSIESIGACGNYVKIFGDFVAVANSADLGLGAMEWCGQEGATAESSGEIRDGKFFAATLVTSAAE